MEEKHDLALPKGTEIKSKAYTYIIEKKLGMGAFGIAYLARMKYKTKVGDKYVDAERYVALKEFVISDYCSRGDGSDTRSAFTVSSSAPLLFERYREKFNEEAKKIRYMIHPNIVEVYDFFEANGTSYYSMKYFSNGSLGDLIKSKGHLSDSETMKYAYQIATALAYMHDYKMLHLDLKPGNIMISDEGEAVLIDFGLAVKVDNSDSGLTIERGTRGYAPVEQEQGNHTFYDFPTYVDVYALGATMYRMATGNTPPRASEFWANGFPMDSFMAAGVGEDVVSLIASCVRHDIADRLQDCHKFIEQYREIVCDKAKAKEIEHRISDLRSSEIFTGHSLDQEGREHESAVKHEIYSLAMEAFSADPTCGKYALYISRYAEGPDAEKIRSRWLLEAAKLGDEEAQMETALEYFKGENLTKNCELGLYWLKVAASGGNRDAQFAIGCMYETGSLKEVKTLKSIELSDFDYKVPVDYEEAARWFRLAAEKNKHEAWASLTRLFYEHKIEEQHKDEAMKYMFKEAHFVLWVLNTGEPLLIRLTHMHHDFEFTCRKFKYFIDNSQNTTGVAEELLAKLNNKLDQTLRSYGKDRAAGQTKGSFVDLGLPSGLLWAEYNLGANSPEGKGDFYAWGGLEPYNTYEMGAYGANVANISQRLEYDAAWVKNAGRIPAKSEFAELIDNCDWKWVKIKGVFGCLGTSKINGNKIFLPALGDLCRGEHNPGLLGPEGYYWCATSDHNLRADFVSISERGLSFLDTIRDFGFQIRPVKDASDNNHATERKSTAAIGQSDERVTVPASCSWGLRVLYYFLWTIAGCLTLFLGAQYLDLLTSPPEGEDLKACYWIAGAGLIAWFFIIGKRKRVDGPDGPAKKWLSIRKYLMIAFFVVFLSMNFLNSSLHFQALVICCWIMFIVGYMFLYVPVKVDAQVDKSNFARGLFLAIGLLMILQTYGIIHG